MSIIAQRTQSFKIQNPACLTIPRDQEEHRNSPRRERQSSAKPRGHHRQGVVLKDTGREVWARYLECLLSLCPPVTLNWLLTIPLLPSLAAVVPKGSSITEATRQLGRPHRTTKGTFARYQVCKPKLAWENTAVSKRLS